MDWSLLLDPFSPEINFDYAKTTEEKIYNKEILDNFNAQIAELENQIEAIEIKWKLEVERK